MSYDRDGKMLILNQTAGAEGAAGEAGAGAEGAIVGEGAAGASGNAVSTLQIVWAAR